jgi:hypothetical protein
MATHAQPLGGGSGDDTSTPSIPKAKLALIGAATTALVTLTPVTVDAMRNYIADHTGGTTTLPTAPPTTIAQTPIQESPLGSIDGVTVDGSKIIVEGTARADVESVVVRVGPRQPDGPRQYWAASADVYDQHWKALVEAETPLPAPFQTKVDYQQRLRAFAGLSFDPDPTTTPAPGPSADIVNCAMERGDDCFTGPGWGPPSVYRSGR